ncbi:hypothetical protein GCM10010174_75860 [Kutzneria viridogrisea]|uniref:V8-like Glu-specific endopeptidase n=1 Tax=Kutzneria viridogrisea TaxID=47990 RepID=A0ABR6BNA6_9PSEU|nr:V8-like Glu-specific endopeptidase [Kutzneria viridogrisea]
MRITRVTGLALALALLGGAPAVASTGPSVHGGATTAEQQQAVDAYWTPDRMRLAGALVPEITPIPPDDTTPDVDTPPAPNTATTGEVWRFKGAVDGTVGRLFFTFSDGYDGSCTATVVGRDTVVTAAHCLRATGADEWRHNVYFVPGYRNGSKPHGGFSARTMITSTDWDTGSSSQDVAAAGHDAAFAVLNRAGGRPVAEVVGSQRIGFTPPASGRFEHAFGYPHVQSGTKWLGARMVHCAGPVQQAPKTPALWGMRCDMAHGASGGPHFAEFDPATGRGRVVGVTTTGTELGGGAGEYSYATPLGPEAALLYAYALTR